MVGLNVEPTNRGQDRPCIVAAMVEERGWMDLEMVRVGMESRGGGSMPRRASIAAILDEWLACA